LPRGEGGAGSAFRCCVLALCPPPSPSSEQRVFTTPPVFCTSPGGRGSPRREHRRNRVVDVQSAARRGEGLPALCFPMHRRISPAGRRGCRLNERGPRG